MLLYFIITNYNLLLFTKIYIAHMPAGKINRQIELESHKKVDLTNV